MITAEDGLDRCDWAKSPIMRAYHDDEWGTPQRDDDTLFEFLLLEGAQAGLSWETVLKKRDRYREVFDGFDPEAIASYGDEKIATLLADPGIIRNRLKVNAFIRNARAWLDLAESEGSPAEFLWSFVDGEPVRNTFTTMSEVPANTEVSDRMSLTLKKRGFTFVGSTICYAFMQATGMVNDHLVDCWRHAQCG